MFGVLLQSAGDVHIVVALVVNMQKEHQHGIMWLVHVIQCPAVIFFVMKKMLRLFNVHRENICFIFF